MVCPHCKAQWQLPVGSKNNSTNCPFCGGSLYEELESSYTIETALQEVVSRFGMGILSDSDELISSIATFAPNLEKEIQGLVFFDACNGINNFLALNSASLEKANAMYIEQINNMTEIIKQICNAFLAVTGVSLNQEQLNSETSQATEWEYVNLGNNTIEINSYKDALPENITFPSYIDGKKVVSIGSTALGINKTKGADRLCVKSVNIPIGVTSIGSGAFDGCKALVEISLPEGLTSIGDNAFRGCKLLANISLPNSITYIGKGAFSGCNIQSVVLPGSIKNVPADAFKNCKKLISATLLEGIVSIQQSAFSGCKALSGVVLPQSLNSIESNAFYECKALCTIELPENITIINYQTFKWSGLTNIHWPSKVTTIDNDAFCGCDFSTVTIPDGVKYIRDYSISDCWSLREVMIPKSVTKIEDDAFFNVEDEITILCYENSYAHKWAIKKGIEIEIIK